MVREASERSSAGSSVTPVARSRVSHSRIEIEVQGALDRPAEGARGGGGRVDWVEDEPLGVVDLDAIATAAAHQEPDAVPPEEPPRVGEGAWG